MWSVIFGHGVCSVSAKSRSKEGGEVRIFPRDQSKLDIPMTTSKRTKLGKGGGGEHPGTPFRENTEFGNYL